MQIVETPGHGLFAEQPKYLRVSEWLHLHLWR
jgi:hypothetical protein